MMHRLKVLATTLEMADVGATIDDGGKRPVPTFLYGAKPRFVPVISARVASEIQEMMEAVVSEGTGVTAQIPGVVVAGKTGTAEKIDPATHTYSHTKLVASFAGFAPLSDPAIAVAVVIDTPTAGGEDLHYGGAASAPVFAEVAQEVLEYLGVPHDQPLKTKQQMEEARAMPEHDDAPSDNDSIAERARRRSLCGASVTTLVLVGSWMVVIWPWRMPTAS